MPPKPDHSARFRSLRRTLLACTALSAASVAQAPPAAALPQNGTIAQGSGTIATSGTTMTVTQNSAKLVIDWSSFNIAAGEKVVFVQMDQLMQALNRVVGGQASVILGSLSANATVIITNPNGILFGNGAQVNVGAIIATTAGITDAGFMAGKLKFDIPSDSATASVVNRGTITAAEAGLVGLVAPGVENSGIIQARLGVVQMAAGNTFAIDLYGDRLIRLAVGDPVTRQVRSADGRELASLVSNTGTLSADGGVILLTAGAARDIVRNVINLEGIAMARSVSGRNGEIVLDGAAAGTVRVAGTLDAGGTDGAAGGAVTVRGDDIVVVDGARLLASGTAGGSVKVGAWDSGSVSLARDSLIDASAGGNGDGGEVAVVARATIARGAIRAEGGVDGGNGGRIETSGHTLDIGGATVRASAPRGKAGTWLLDPYDLTVDAAAAGSIGGALATTNVTLQTTANGSSGYGIANGGGDGDIIVNSAIGWSADTVLTLSAYRGISVNAAISGPNGGLSLSGAGGVAFGGAVAVGRLDVVAGGDITQTAALTVGGASSFATTGAGRSILLTDTGNRLSGTVSLRSAGDASLTNTWDTVLGTSVVGGGLTVRTYRSSTTSGVLSNIQTTNGLTSQLTTIGSGVSASGTDASLLQSLWVNNRAGYLMNFQGMTQTAAVTQATAEYQACSGTCTDQGMWGHGDYFAIGGTNPFNSSFDHTQTTTTANTITTATSPGPATTSVTNGNQTVTTTYGTTTTTTTTNTTTTVDAGVATTTIMHNGGSSSFVQDNKQQTTTSTSTTTDAETPWTQLTEVGGSLAQAGSLSVGGATTLISGHRNDIILGNAGNRFGGTVTIASGRNVVLAAASAPAVDNHAVGTLTVTTPGKPSAGQATAVTDKANQVSSETLQASQPYRSLQSLAAPPTQAVDGIDLARFASGPVRLSLGERASVTIDPTLLRHGTAQGQPGEGEIR
ncbi:filamentous hemagglutinin N-terminal domain-containing protein [Magnetospirillum sp. 15-1]|uniref:two-partner secretion domain-containing protein n=1 Tax=Magnetospirillum sp. 15-1 TaxID=1979370 RepID=UPI000BBCEE56|nr:filamentous hemagglutinin N-terminal domain-containing protein [Magnetospirillum sp. 15-1]